MYTVYMACKIVYTVLYPVLYTVYNARQEDILCLAKPNHRNILSLTTEALSRFKGASCPTCILIKIHVFHEKINSRFRLYACTRFLFGVENVHDAAQRMDKPIDKADAKHVDSKAAQQVLHELAKSLSTLRTHC